MELNSFADNTISGCRDVSIAVYANGGNGSAAPAGAHNMIGIIGNEIRNSTNPAIAVTSTRGLKLYDNTIEAPDNSGLLPWRLNAFGRQEDPLREVYLENVEDVTGAPSTRLKEWRDRHRIAQDGSEDLVDFAGDGVPALYKLAFNLGDPRDKLLCAHTLDTKQPELGGLPALKKGQFIQYIYLQLKGDHSGITYSCEFTPDSLSNNWNLLTDNNLMYDSISSLSFGEKGYELVSVALSEYALNNNFFRVIISTTQ